MLGMFLLIALFYIFKVQLTYLSQGHGIFNSDGEIWKAQRKTAALIFNVKVSCQNYD